MKLQNRENAFVPVAKLQDYLLSETHPDGRSKAAFFRGLGFHERNISFLMQELLNIALNEEVNKIITTPHGTKYIIDGNLHTPVGLIVGVRTLWVIEWGYEDPRFVTAYPLR